MRIRTLWVVGVSLGLTVPSLADSPDARAILDQAETAIHAVKAVRYKGQGQAEGALAARLPKIEGSVTLVPIPGTDIPKIRLEAQVVPPLQMKAVTFQLAADGKRISLAEHGNKIFIQRDLPGGAGLLSNVSGLLVRELVSEQPFARESKAVSLKYMGIETVEGVECDVVYAVLVQGGDEVRWYFGRTDHLPRRVQRIIPGMGGPSGQTTVTTSLMSLETLPSVGEELFQLERPAGFTDVSAGNTAGPRQLLETGSAAPDWTLKDADGKEITLTSLRGKLVLLDFWATWCAPCRQAMPGVQKLHEKYKGKPVAIYGVNCWERDPRSNPVDFMKKSGFTYPQLLNGGPVAEAYHAAGIPTFYLIAPDGKVLLAFSGYSQDGERQLETTIERELAKITGS